MTDVSILTGPGRLHLFDAAQALADEGIDVQMICGWAPRTGRMRALDAIGRIVGQPDLSARLGERRKQLAGRALISECAPADILQAALSMAARMRLLNEDRASLWSFSYFGRAARRKLVGARVVQVRSGAGQGGAIRRAREQGSRVLVDHSIAHPRTMARVLRPEYARYGLPIDTQSPFWRLVMTDCDQADTVLVNSDYVKDTFLENGFSPERLAVAYLGVRHDFIGAKQRYSIGPTINLLFTGHFELRKGARTLLDACEILKKRQVRFLLKIIGFVGTGRHALSGRNLDDEVEFVPYTSKEGIRRHLADADMFVFPTLVEGSSRSAMEALAAGLPVITTRACGVPITNNVNGLYVEAGDAIGLADQIEQLASDEIKRASIGSAACALIRSTYSWSDYARQLARIYRSL